MASVAVALKERGFKVTGSDENVYPPMSTFLQEKSISLKEGYRAENIPADADVVVIGNAMTRGSCEAAARPALPARSSEIRERIAPQGIS